MDEYPYLYFDLPSLMQLTKIDIKKAARINIDMITGDYFEWLSKFLAKAHSAIENIEKLLKNDSSSAECAETFSLANLENMANILKIIGCEECSDLASEVVRLSRRGNKDYITEQAKKLITYIDEIYNQVDSCKREKKPEPLTGILNVDEIDYEKYNTYLLNKTLKIVEVERANRKPEILAVDDSPTMLKTISSVLSDSYKVYGMSNPLKIKDFLKQITPDLFLLDYQMPELSGFDLVPMIREFEKHKNTPIIFLTSSGSPDRITEAINLGACDYVVKPFHGQQLREKIAKHIKKKH